MNNKHSGSCLCGAIRFEIVGDFDAFYLCHCKHCQKGTGAAYAANLFSSNATLHWVSGEDQVTEFILPSTQHTKSFCSVCSSALPNLQLDDTLLMVPAGCLDSEINIKPTSHIFTSSKAKWEKELERIPSADKLPT